MSLHELRSKIDAIDEQVLALVSERARLAIQVGHVKAAHGRPPFVPGREVQLLERIEQLNQGPLDGASARAIFREIISACRNLERPVTVAYLGPQATWSHVAALQQFGQAAEYEPARSIGEVFAAVETRRQDFGIVPVENSTAGAVGDTLDGLAQTSLTVCAEVLGIIQFALLSNETDLGQIRRVYSLPIAAEQCRRWLGEHLAHAEITDASSTARAAELAAKESHAAAVAAGLAAEIHGMSILASSIDDSAQNRTRFFVLGRHSNDPCGRDKTSILFAVPHRPGSLNSALQCLERHGVNLTMINSRPTKQMPWEYLFFVDVQGHVQDEGVAAALAEMRERCAFLRVLGSYPEAQSAF